MFNRRGTVALEDFSFAIHGQPPAITAIVGESGSGKTTLARLLFGLVTPSAGEGRYQGKDLRRLTDRERRAFLHDVQAIFQDPFEVYNPFYKVDHVLEVPIRNFGLARFKREIRAKMVEVLEEVGLRVDETLGRCPHQLSEGQRQRIMVARALLLRPRLIIADEPVSMVDASLRATILGSLLQLNREFGISLICITHDLATAYQLSQDIIVLYRGTVAEAGDVERVVGAPEHPYTRLLVESIPLPEPDRAWRGESALGQGAAITTRRQTYCRFIERCPYAMPICGEQAPPLFQPDPRWVSACYRYRDAPTLPRDEMLRVFAGGQPLDGRAGGAPASLDDRTTPRAR